MKSSQQSLSTGSQTSISRCCCLKCFANTFCVMTRSHLIDMSQPQFCSEPNYSADQVCKDLLITQKFGLFPLYNIVNTWISQEQKYNKQQEIDYIPNEIINIIYTYLIDCARTVDKECEMEIFLIPMFSNYYNNLIHNKMTNSIKLIPFSIYCIQTIILFIYCFGYWFVTDDDKTDLR